MTDVTEALRIYPDRAGLDKASFVIHLIFNLLQGNFLMRSEIGWVDLQGCVYALLYFTEMTSKQFILLSNTYC